MLREESERDLDREFTRIETWDEFLTRWRAIDTEQEAVGLLYAGTTVVPVPQYVHDKTGDVPQCVNFYLKWATHGNEAVQTTARQLIIKHWLRATPLRTEFVEAHRLLLGFLSEVAEGQARALEEAFYAEPPLFRPPYPRFVSEYLLRVHKVWYAPERYSDRDHKAFQYLTEPLTDALCWWGLAYVLAQDYRGKKTMPAIERFLERRGFKLGDIFFGLSGHGDPMSDLTSHHAQDEVKERAARALIKMRYWFGPGVKEGFDKSIPNLRKLEEKF